MNVLLLSRYSRAGNSSRVRTYQYLSLLKHEGIEVTEAPLSGDAFVADLYAGRRRNWAAIAKSYIQRIRTLLRAGNFDLLWIERELFPYAPALAESFISRTGFPYVVDYDDAIFHNYDRHANPLVRLFLSEKINRVMRHATLVIAGNRYLADHAHRAGARWVEQIPSTVDTAVLTPRRGPFSTRFRVGWIGTPLNTRYLECLRQPLSELASDREIEVTLIGADKIDLGAIPLTIRPWSEEREADEIRSFDVGVMPLPDSPWERGKCGYKILQYFACGVPAVASPVGANRTIVENSVNGFLADGPDQWADALKLLKRDPDRRRSMGEAGRRKVEREYSIAVAAPRVAALLRRAAGET